MEIRYPAVLEPESGGFFVRFVDAEEPRPTAKRWTRRCSTPARRCRGFLGWMLDDNRPIPEPSPAGEGMYLIAPQTLGLRRLC